MKEDYSKNRVTLRINERHEVEVEESPQGWYSVAWRKLVKERSGGYVCIPLVTWHKGRPTSEVRFETRSTNSNYRFIGPYRIVEIEGKWYIELFEEAREEEVREHA